MPPTESLAPWPCSCGRQVPARFDVCHCGGTREQQQRAAEAGREPQRKPSLLRVGVRVGAVAAVVAVGAAWFLTAGRVKALPTPSPAASVLLLQASPAVAPTIAPSPTMPHWQPAPEPQYEPPVITGDGGTEYGRSVPVPPSDAPPANEGPSEMDQLRAKTESWRARWRPVAERIAELEKEIPKLEAMATKVGSVPYEDQNPSKNDQIMMEGQYVKGRLEAARKELADARRELSDIEEAARRDGVPAGQLY